MRNLSSNEAVLVSGGLIPGPGDVGGALSGGAFADLCSEIGWGFGGIGGALIGLGAAAGLDYNFSNAGAAQAVSDAYTSGAAL